MSSVTVFEKVASGELSPQAATDLLMREKESKPTGKPRWIPSPFYTIGIFLLAALLSLVTGSEQGLSSDKPSD